MAELNKAKAKSFPFDRLPNKLLEKVSSYLTVKEILAFQAASKKFYDFCLDFDERLWLPLVKREHPNLYQQICDRPAASWKAVYLLFKSTDRYVSCVQQHNEKPIQYVTSRNQALQEERDQALEESQRIAKDLASLQTVQGDSLRPEQETMFTSMVKLKLRRSENGVIQAHNVRGRPTNLLQLRSVEKGSADASSSTLRQCSKFYENVETVCSTNKKDTEAADVDITKQCASLMKRNKDGYLQAAKIGGLTIFKRFKLQPETALSLKKELPLNLWKTVKRALNDDLGIDLMGTERELREGLKNHGEFDYEVGEFTNKAGEVVTFLRVTDVEQFCKSSLEDLKKSGLISKDHNNIHLLVCGDKGGDTTKIIGQFTDSLKSHSVRNAKLFGIYQGSKENRENIENAFGPISVSLVK